jgi:formylglycine-generating enzyme required for sulfatase activity
VAVLFLSVTPIVGLVLWAELPSECYPVLNKLTKHGRYSTMTAGQLTKEEYYRFGKQVRAVTYGYHANGKKRSQATWVDGKLNGVSRYWFDNDQLRADEIFVNGKRHGRFTWYTSDGKLERTMNYVDGISQEQIDAAKKAGVEPVIEVDLGDGVKMRMIFIPPGEFMMGSTPEEIAMLNKKYNTTKFDWETPQHPVSIKQGFYLSESEVTQEQLKALTGDNTSIYPPPDTSPATNISWNEIHAFLKKSNSKHSGIFRLPSEAEWEYACRAGTTTRFCFGDDYADLEDYAWCYSSSWSRTGGMKKANNFGLYDMHGNVWELCEDIWHESYQGAPNNGEPWVDSPQGFDRVMRGGGFATGDNSARSASRWYTGSPYNNYGNVGFRLAMDLPTAKPQDKKP